MEANKIYLLTQKLSKKGDVEVKKYACKDMDKARKNFDREVAFFKADGYEGAEQAMYDVETYIRVAKLTNKGGDVFRIRLEAIELYE